MSLRSIVVIEQLYQVLGIESSLMNSSGEEIGKSNIITTSSSVLTTNDVYELTNTLREFNNNFKRNITVLTEIKDHMVKILEKQDIRPVDDNLDIHRLDRVSLNFYFYINLFVCLLL